MTGPWLLVLGLILSDVAQAAIIAGSVVSGDCVCATTTVNGRDGAGLSHNILTKLHNGDCAIIKGSHTTADGYTWFEINFFGQNLWVAGDFFIKGSGCSTNAASCPPIVTRSQWGARAPTATAHMPTPADYVFIHHAASSDCHDQSSCASLVRSFQHYHMDSHGWNDIGYTFLIGGDGSVFEGRGWDHLGAHTGGYNSVGFGFCFIGNFMDHAPTDIQIQRAKEIIACGVAKGKIKSAYTLRGHRDMGSTLCPGDVLYNMIRTWPHY